MKNLARLSFLYTVFATIATIINIGTQAIVVWIYEGSYELPLSIFIGTVTSLPIKYLLEKKYIFGFVTNNLSHDGKTFLIYTSMGIITTLIFWGIEWAFHLAFETDYMRYIGGAIGLALGYTIKYHLDKSFVFIKRESLKD